MISRVAENLYWLGRYVERSQAMARLLRTTAAHTLDAPGLYPWTAVVVVAGEQDPFVERYGLAAQEDEDRVLGWLTWDTACGVSIRSSVRYARENARTTRDVLSREVWEILNHGWLWLEGPESRALYVEDLNGFFVRIRDLGHMVMGAAQSTLPQGDELALIELGQFLERADQTARALDVYHHALAEQDASPTPDEDAAATVAWQTTLLTCGAREAYFRQNRGSVRGARVADLLLLDARFPRSVRHALRAALERLAAVCEPDRQVEALVAGQAVSRLLQRLEGGPIEQLLSRGIHEELTTIVDGVAEVGQGLYPDLFDPPHPGSSA